MAEKKADIAVIGLGVMGENLALNFRDKGYTVAVYNRHQDKTDEFTSKNPDIIPIHDLKEISLKLALPRKILMMIKAGSPIDEMIDLCSPFLEKGDCLIDGGNSYYLDTERRAFNLEKKGIHYLGLGVSGGEEGARHGPSLMPGGSEAAWKTCEKMLTAIAAKYKDGSPCVAYLGKGGAGHYVKMVHNGIEYGDMQLICEAYDILIKKWKLSSLECSKVFAEWNKGELSSFLIEITSKVLSYQDRDGSYLVEKILDVAGQKGTGKWTSESALELFEPLSLITEAVFCRYISTKKELRTKIGQIYSKMPTSKLDMNVTKEDLGKALFTAKIISYAQGFALLSEASKKHEWNLPLSKIALLWRSGCIIRSQFLDILAETFQKEKDGTHLLLSGYFQEVLKTHTSSWRKVVAEAFGNGIPIPCMASSLAYFDSIKDPRLPANLLQAQRDCFGAHTYERVDTPRGQFFHTEWEKPLMK